MFGVVVLCPCCELKDRTLFVKVLLQAFEMDSRLVSAGIFLCVVLRCAYSFMLPTYGSNNYLQPMQPMNGFQPMQPMQPLPGMTSYPPMTFDFAGQQPNPNFPTLHFPQIYVPSVQIPNQPGVSVLNNSASAQGPNGAGSGVSVGASASGPGAHAGGSAQSSGSGSSSDGYQSSSHGMSFMSSGLKKAYSQPAYPYQSNYLGQITAWGPSGYY
ncbi:uncharacterized protein LOC129588413 [Paramacrobiotus metropolitanus]|uniref:uncharacterized protein LOC129588413 n=1 Tax=Paramacrobiotus metropolitanus TaxID=2943436 RepID=UPI002445D6D4|nr:uncharacterized protein LOC129588413 [Paramacrobiotus metropolitanus]